MLLTALVQSISDPFVFLTTKYQKGIQNYIDFSIEMKEGDLRFQIGNSLLKIKESSWKLNIQGA